MTVPVSAAFIFGDYGLVPYFSISAAVALILGLLMWKKFERKDLTYGSAIVVAAFAWLLISLFGSIPFIFGGRSGSHQCLF